jgi:hypothetical protein
MKIGLKCRRAEGMLRKSQIPAMILLATIGIAGGAAAQDSQYWTNQYGTRAELLGGVVVGSIKDLASTFYISEWTLTAWTNQPCSSEENERSICPTIGYRLS